jgi:hypothetical protein
MKIAFGASYVMDYVDWLHKKEISRGFTHGFILSADCQEDQEHQG